MRPLARRGGTCLTLPALLLAACSPALDWRDVRPEGAPLQLQFPCRPLAQQRSVPLAGAPVPLQLQVCSAADASFALAHADLADPARVGPALQQLAAAARENLQGRIERSAPFAPTGATPNEAALRQRIIGRRPDGQALQMELAVFAIGTRVFQATVLGAQIDDAAAEAFIASVHPAR